MSAHTADRRSLWASRSVVGRPATPAAGPGGSVLLKHGTTLEATR